MRESAFENIKNSEKQRKKIRFISASLERPWWQWVSLFTFMAILFIEFWGLIGTKLIAPWQGWGDGIQALHGLVDVASSFPAWFTRWDSGYYLLIVESGYATTGAGSFFPLYPLLVSAIHQISGLPILWSGLLISVACFLASSILLYKFTLIDYRSNSALWTVIWYSIFPVAFFLVSFYAESLFLLLSIASIYFARKGNFITSGIAISLAGATRPYGFLLAVPFFIEFFQQRNFQRSQWLKWIIGALIAPLGALAYLIFLGQQTGNHNLVAAYMSTTTNWNGFSFTWPWNTFLDGLRAAFFGTGLSPDWFSRALSWQDMSYTLFGLVVSISAFKFLRPSLSAYLAVSMVFFLMSHGPKGYAFWSMPRHVLVLFPIYMVLAILTEKLPRQFRWAMVAVSILLLGLFSAWFASGRWVA